MNTALTPLNETRLIGRAVEVTLWDRERKTFQEFESRRDKIFQKSLLIAFKEAHYTPNEEQIARLLPLIEEEWNELVARPEIMENIADDYYKLDRGIWTKIRFREYAVSKGWKHA